MGIEVTADLLDVCVKKPEDLSSDERRAWVELRARNPALYSPYFHPDYTCLIGDLRDDAHIAIVREGQTCIAFFPFQCAKTQNGFARPIGAPMTDYHGFIHAADGPTFDFVNILSQAGIGAYHYTALVDNTGELCRYNTTEDISATIDITTGAQTWRAERDSSYRRHLKSNRRRIRKAEEKFGERRLIFKSKDRDVFDQLINWKREKFKDTGKYDVLSSGWTLDMLERLWLADDESAIRCDMQVLYFGDRIAAIDLGLTDGPTFHSWMVAYDSELHSFAPGIQLLEGLIDAAGDAGYTRIDLGAGIEGYKKHYATENVTVGSGFVAVRGPAAALSQIYGATEKWGQKALGDAPGKLRRRYSQIAACDETFTGRAKAMLEAVKSNQK